MQTEEVLLIVCIVLAFGFFCLCALLCTIFCRIHHLNSSTPSDSRALLPVHVPAIQQLRK